MLGACSACWGFEPGLFAWPFRELVARVGMPLADTYLEFLGGRCRPNRVRAAAYDLKVFFSVAGKPPEQVGPADVLAFITAQRTGQVAGRGVLQPLKAAAGPGGVSAATVRRRLSIVSGFLAFSPARGDVTANPVPRGLPTRRERSRPGQGVPLVRAARRRPRILAPAEVDALMAALFTHRDRARVAAMVPGGLRRCEVLGLRMGDLHAAERRVFVAAGQGGRQRLIPVSGRFFAVVAAYLDAERPPGAGTDRVFVVLKGAAPRAAANGQGDGCGPGRGAAPGRAGSRDLPRAAAHLPDPAAGGGDGAGGGAGPGRPRLDRVDPDLPAPGR